MQNKEAFNLIIHSYLFIVLIRSESREVIEQGNCLITKRTTRNWLLWQSLLINSLVKTDLRHHLVIKEGTHGTLVTGNRRWKCSQSTRIVMVTALGFWCHLNFCCWEKHSYVALWIYCGRFHQLTSARLAKISIWRYYIYKALFHNWHAFET